MKIIFGGHRRDHILCATPVLVRGRFSPRLYAPQVDNLPQMLVNMPGSRPYRHRLSELAEHVTGGISQAGDGFIREVRLSSLYSLAIPT
jgi:hypothetical protein